MNKLAKQLEKLEKAIEQIQDQEDVPLAVSQCLEEAIEAVQAAREELDLELEGDEIEAGHEDGLAVGRFGDEDE